MSDMALSDINLQGEFEPSGGHSGPVDLLSELLALLPERFAKRTPYWDKLQGFKPTCADLDRILPADKLPQLVDGEISYDVHDYIHPEQRKHLKRRSYSATKAAKFLDAIDYIQHHDPDYLRQFAAELNPTVLMDCILALHVTGEATDVKDIWVQEIRDPDGFLLQAADMIKSVGNNSVYDFERSFDTATNKLVDGYLKTKLPQYPVYTYEDDDVINPILSFAMEFGLSKSSLTHIVQNATLPQSLATMHADTATRLQTALIESPEWVDCLLKAQDNFDEFTADDKLSFGRDYLNLLASQYGVNPPPTLDWLDEAADDDAGYQTPWSTDNKYDNFAHPMGKIFLKQSVMKSANYFLITLSHEFAHALEEVALYSLNPEFQRWLDKEGQDFGIKVGHQQTKACLASAALAISFNNVSQSIPGHIPDREAVPYFREGTYFSHAAPRAEGEQDTEADKMDELYLYQLKERHARSVENFLPKKINKVLDLARQYSNPTEAILYGRWVMHSVDAHFQQHVVPVDNEEWMAKWLEIQEHSRAADMGDVNMERLGDIGSALVKSSLLSIEIGRQFADKRMPATLMKDARSATQAVSLCHNLLKHLAQQNPDVTAPVEFEGRMPS